MNTNHAILLFFFILSINVFSQSNEEAKENLLNTISIETCDCIAKKNLDFKSHDSNKLQLEFGLCILEGYSNNKAEADKYLNISFDDQRSLELLGEQVAMKMFTNCPDYILALTQDTQTDEYLPDSNNFVITGKISGIEKNQFNIIEFKDDTNRVHKLLWLEYFDGEHLLHSDSDFKNLNLEVTYYESEMFDPVIMEYRNFKVITKLSAI
ncbi:hypothetical protein V8G69_09550 [Gaetbulibacter sp. M235]|uniref:hypothetical protein n=1 Tax=Gaetbulibacter sp. M235 TaxID=3126510 RepID=UPI00374F3328